MAQNIPLYIVDVYMSNEGEPESALELNILRFSKVNLRPQVYVHTYVQPTCKPNLIRWNDAAKKGMPRDLFTNQHWPSLADLIAADFLRDKYVVCFCPNFEPYRTLVTNSTACYSILNLWQEVFAGNEDISSIVDYRHMLEYIGLPVKDNSNTLYTPLMKRTHALLAIAMYLFRCHGNRSQPGFAEKCEEQECAQAFWPLESVPQPWYDHAATSFRDISTEALCSYFSDRLPDYINWFDVVVYNDKWVFSPDDKEKSESMHIAMQDVLFGYILNNFLDLTTVIKILTFYALYQDRTSYALDIALRQGTNLNALPQSIKEDFAHFLLDHCYDFLTLEKKRYLLVTLFRQLFDTRDNRPTAVYHYDELKKKEDENGLTFEEQTIPSNRNLVWYREIREENHVKYRCFLMHGSQDERGECIDFINPKLQELVKEASNPFADCWISEDMKQWIFCFTGSKWRDIARPSSPQDSESLKTMRMELGRIIKAEMEPYFMGYVGKVRDMVNAINDLSEKEDFRHVFYFQGITYELLVEKTTENMSLGERVKRLFK